MQKFNAYIIRAKWDLSPAFCPKCGQDKPIAAYYAHSVRGDGAVRYRPYCKECRRKAKRSPRSRPIHAQILKSGVQQCKFCKKPKPVSEFYANGCFSDGVKKYRSRCKECVLTLAKQNQPVLYRTKSEHRSTTPKNFISGILNHAAKRKQHLGFDIDLGYLLELYDQQHGRCAISGECMTYQAGAGRVRTNISIDRIDSSKGYVRGNVQFVCDVVNRMKADMHVTELQYWCKKILEQGCE